MCLKDVKCLSEACGGVRPLSAGGLRSTKMEAGWYGSCSLERLQFRGHYRIFCEALYVCVCVHAVSIYAHLPMCEHVCVSIVGGVMQGLQNSQWTGIFRTGPCGQRRRRERYDDEDCWWLADWVQQGWSSLLMKSHLRPPFTLNMGHCSCPDLGFDP